VAAMREDRHVFPFHWEVEFPEVFDRERPGFDAMIGNPPFAGKNTLTASNPTRYGDWLKQVHEESHGNADLVAHFFRRAFGLVRPEGCFGLIATNTIGQGDTRSTGLRWIRTHGGTIYEARKRVKWPLPGAAVVVSVVHVYRGEIGPPYLLDRLKVGKVTAYLFHAGGDEDPMRLAGNAGKSFQGSIVLGMGFTFDDTDSKGVASPLSEMHRLVAKDPRNAERIFPYIGGEEVNTSPTLAHHRYVIQFDEMSEQEARSWPDLWRILEERVKPERMKQDADKYPRMVHEWWKFWNNRQELAAGIAGLDRVLMHPFTSTHLCFAFVPASTIVAGPHNVFAFDSVDAFAVLQGRVHEIWTRFFGSSLEDRLRYTPSDCFETFPFPTGWRGHGQLEDAGKIYYDFRAALMVRNDEGLTKTYNRVHDPDERSEDIRKLRELHTAMDRAVLDAYGWTDILTDCDFLLDYEPENEEPGKRKKPWRYRWPDHVRDEVLARLLALNAKRAELERLELGDHGARKVERRSEDRSLSLLEEA